MNREELPKTFMMISNSKQPFSLHGLNKNNSELQGLNNNTVETMRKHLHSSPDTAVVSSSITIIPGLEMTSIPGDKADLAPMGAKRVVSMSNPSKCKPRVSLGSLMVNVPRTKKHFFLLSIIYCLDCTTKFTATSKSEGNTI